MNLFYFESGNVLCWVAGYTPDGNTMNLQMKVESLLKYGKEFAAIAGVPIENVNTKFIQKSSQYKYMRVFYATVTEAPEGAFVLDNGWNMWDWIEK